MANDKISMDELFAQIANPTIDRTELAKYFREKTDAGGPFSPELELNPDTVAIPRGPEGRERSALLLNSTNWLERGNRQARFNKLIASGKYKGPVIVSEGDSWFLYPFLLWDTIDVLMEDLAVYSVGAAGDTLDNMVREAEYRKALKRTKASILLLSGGGNDLVAGGNLASHLRPFAEGRPAPDYLLPSFDGLVAQAVRHFDTIARDVKARFPKVHIVTHGYDYAIPNAGRWLGKPMQKQGIKDRKLQKEIAREMMDRFNTQMARWAARWGHVHYLDLRKKVGDGRWHDELHPTNPGYKAVAAVFKKKITDLSKAKPRSRSAGGPKGISLHIGLNNASEAHYGDALIPLDCCIADATEMEAIAKDCGYGSRTILKDDQGTRDAVLTAVKEAQKKLKDGDIFFLSYAGHGGQIQDLNEDEPGGPDEDWLDETLCLYDGQLIDDELFYLWSGFAEGVRIVTVFDCCHSGSVIRTSMLGGVPEPEPEGKARMMPPHQFRRVLERNLGMYRGIVDSLEQVNTGVTHQELSYPIKATVLQLSGCQSNQKAMEHSGNGVFTKRLIETYAGGTDTGYRAFMDAIIARMPSRQTPKYWQLGLANPAFELQRPFQV